MDIVQVLRELKWADSICVVAGAVVLQRGDENSEAIARDGTEESIRAIDSFMAARQSVKDRLRG